jgi:hypothetical protein
MQGKSWVKANLMEPSVSLTSTEEEILRERLSGLGYIN